MDILTTLQTLNCCHGPAGDEGEIADKIAELARPFADEITRDTLGNLFVHRKGSGPRVMFAAHMDSIGFIVTHIDDKGFLRFGKVGGLRAASCLHAPVHFKNGVKGAVVLDCGTEVKDMTLDDLCIDIGARDRAEAETMVRVGDTAVFDAPAADECGSKHTSSSVLGGGAAIKVMDSSVICHPQMVQRLDELARASGIPAQRDVIRAGGTDAGAIHASRGGVYTGGISVPCRYVHAPVEMADRRDVKACAALAAAFAQAELE